MNPKICWMNLRDEQGRAAAVGNNQWPCSKRNDEKKQGRKERHGNRQAWDLWQSIPIGFFAGRTGPGHQRSDAETTMVTVTMVAYTVNVNDTGRRYLEIEEAGF